MTPYKLARIVLEAAGRADAIGSGMAKMGDNAPTRDEILHEVREAAAKGDLALVAAYALLGLASEEVA